VRILIRVQKFNPESDARPHFRDYGVEALPGTTLLSALLKIKSDVDGTLTFRASCRAAICGSCAMQVNGIPKLACRLSLRDEMDRHGQVTIAPLAHLPVIKDLVVRMESFWDKVTAITPYVVSGGDVPPTTALQGLHEDLHNADGCIMCGACLAACQSAEVSPGFLGPAALAKAYRFQVDPRDRTHEARLAALQGADGIWDCVRCNFCVSVCPKDVAPMEQIIRLRQRSIEAGLSESIGARHITQFVKGVGEEGRLNETQLPLRMTWGDWRAMWRLLPLGIKMFLRGKSPFPFAFHPGRRDVRALFKGRRTGPHAESRRPSPE